MVQLHLPFKTPEIILQPYANIWRSTPTQAGEPFGFRYRDGSIFYPGAQPSPAVATGDNFHNGIDYDLPMRTRLFSPADGVVSFRDLDSTGFGKALIITHDTVKTLYGHLTEWEVESVGQHVKQGQPIALSGGRPEFVGNIRPGFSTGPHLHWSVIRLRDGHFVNPGRLVQLPVPTGDEKRFHSVHFTVKAMSDGKPVTIYASPSKTASRRGRVPGGSAIQCTGWQLGDAKWDPTALGGHWDRRWYQCDRGWVASARVVGDAPGSHP